MQPVKSAFGNKLAAHSGDNSPPEVSDDETITLHERIQPRSRPALEIVEPSPPRANDTVRTVECPHFLVPRPNKILEYAGTSVAAYELYRSDTMGSDVA